MVVVPLATPVTTPVEETLAIEELPLLQAPPATVSLRVTVLVAHTLVGPVMVPAKGVALTVMVLVAATVPQVLLLVYEIIAEPAARPVTTPEVLTEAIDVAVLVHVPPATLLARALVVPIHTDDDPVIALRTMVESTMITREAVLVSPPAIIR